MEVAPKGLRLLSFDGGGIRGLAGLLVVLEMMQRLMFDLNLRKIPRPCEYFEVAIGSGTGGLCAILLGRLGFTAEDAIYQYIRIAKVAFSDSRIEPKQRVEKLREVLRDVLKDAGLEADATMEGTDSAAGGCKTIICTAALGDVTRTRLLRSYRGRAFHSPSCKIIDAILATLAAPGIFEPITIEGIGASEDFIDGDISCGNPTIELLREAADIFGPHVKLFSIVSLGSGREITETESSQGSGPAAQPVVTRHMHFSIACERTHEDLQRRTRNLNIYFRFNPGRDIDTPQTKEWGKVSLLKTKTTSYLQTEMVSQLLDNAVSSLHSTANFILLSVINTSTRPDFRDAISASLGSQSEINFNNYILSTQKTAPAQGAMHEKCLEGTRRPIMERIRQWAESSQSQKPIFWLCDSAGTGKSTIAVTMGEEWGHSNLLAGQFCFSNSTFSTSTTSLFFTTIAVDMASKIPELRSKIADVFKNDPMLVNRGLAEQFEKLVLEPLKKLSRELILIIDAVDECEVGSRNQLLKLLVQQLPLIPHLKLFITSRPEHDITLILKTSAVVHTVEFQLQTTEIVTNVNDVSIYIHHHLSNILSEEQCQLLIERANGLFIWASTAKRELDPSTAIESTDDIFERLMSSGDSENLGMLYHNILERAVPHPKYTGIIIQILGLLSTIQEPFSMESLEAFIPGKPVENLMRRLRSVFNFKSRDDPILFFHPTFREYLLASGRETFVIDIANSHFHIASRCFTFMKTELKQDICGTGISIGYFPDNDDIPNRLTMLNSSVTSTLLYSVKYWFVHTEYCIENEEIMDKILAFFREDLLHWVEMLSFGNQISVGIKGLYGLRKRIKALKAFLGQLIQVEHWCHDTLRLMQTQQRVLEANAFAIYSTVVTSAPREGILYENYHQKIGGSIPKVLKGWQNKWPSHTVLLGHKSSIRDLAISNDGTKIASASIDKTLQIWDVATGASLCDPIRHSSELLAVVFIRNDSQIVTGSFNGQLAIWKVATGEAVGPILQSHTNPVVQLSASSDGTRLIAASIDRKFRLWSIDDLSAAPVVIEGHTSSVASVRFSPDGMLIASAGSYDNTVRLWDGMNGTSVGVPLVGHSEYVSCVAFSPTGDLIASGSWDHTIRLWSVETGACVGRPFHGHSHWVHCVSFSADGTTIVSGSKDETIRLWNVATRECISQLRGHIEFRCVVFLPEGDRIVSESDDNTLRIWDLDVQQEDEETQKDRRKSIAYISFSPCGSKIVTCSSTDILQVWSAEKGDLVWETRGEEVYSLAFSPDGSTILLGAAHLRFWDVETGQCFKVIRGDSWIFCIAFSHDGSRIISGGDKLRLWDSQKGVVIGDPFKGHTEKITCVAFSTDDSKIVSGSNDHTVRLWDIIGRPLQLYSHKSYVRITIFSNDNLHILSACDEEVAVWDVLSSDNVARFPHFHSSPTKLLPAHIQDFTFDITNTSDGLYQYSKVINSIQSYFNDPQVSFNPDARTITLSKSSDYLYHVPAHLPENCWKGSQKRVVFGGRDGHVTILDFSHCSTERSVDRVLQDLSRPGVYRFIMLFAQIWVIMASFFD